MSKSSTLTLLDAIKQSFYGLGYSIYSIQESGLEKEYNFLLNKGFIELHRNPTTDEMTSVQPTKIGLKVGMTIDEKKCWQKVVTNGVWIIISGVTVAVVGGLILRYWFGIGV